MIARMIRSFVIALVSLWSGLVAGSPIVVGVEGYVSSIFLNSYGPRAFEEGDPVSAFYVYDSDSANTPLGFDSSSFPYGIVGAVGPVPFVIPGVRITVGNDFGQQAVGPCPSSVDAYSVRGLGGGQAGSTFFFQVQNCDATAYDASDFPMVTPPLPPLVGNGPGEFLSIGENFFSAVVDGLSVGGFFEVTRVYQVPEPGTLAAFGVGLLALFGARRRLQGAATRSA